MLLSSYKLQHFLIHITAPFRRTGSLTGAMNANRLKILCPFLSIFVLEKKNTRKCAEDRKFGVLQEYFKFDYEQSASFQMGIFSCVATH